MRHLRSVSRFLPFFACVLLTLSLHPGSKAQSSSKVIHLWIVGSPLKGDLPPEVVPLTLVKLSQMAAECPEIHELDINPLLADDKGVLALDARVAVRKPARLFAGQTRFAVRPYPSQWEGQLVLRNNSPIAVRPMRPEDEPAIVKFLEHVCAEDLRLRFFHAVKEFSHQFVARLTQLDYARAMF